MHNGGGGGGAGRPPVVDFEAFIAQVGTNFSVYCSNH